MPQSRGPDRWFFDLWSHVYDTAWVQRIAYRPAHDAVLSELRRSALGRVLDVGCGTGLLATRIQREIRPGATVGCDFSRGMLREAARNTHGLPWVRGNALQLPFCDASFDTLVSTEAFHWFPDQAAALEEFHRVLRPGGRLLLALVSPVAEWLTSATRLGSRLLGEPLLWPTRARLRGQVEAAGFRVESQRSVFRLPAPLLLPCVLTVASRTG